MAVAVHGTGDGSVGSFKSQMKKADGSGARFAIILGSDELAAGKVSVKNLRNGEQSLATLDEAVAAIKLR